MHKNVENVCFSSFVDNQFILKQISFHTVKKTQSLMHCFVIFQNRAVHIVPTAGVTRDVSFVRVGTH